MNARARVNPFTPGAGDTPPVLAGRASEQHTLNQGLNRISHPDGPYAPKHILISGPRGVGKTVLLNWVEKEFATKFKNGSVIRTTSRNIRTMTDLVSVLDRNVIDNSILHGWHAGGSIVTGSGEYGETPVPHVVAPAWGHLLEQSLLSKHAVPEGRSATGSPPLLVTIDEAQNLTGEVAVTIANLAQNLNRSRAQICFILAGTPELMSHLISVGPEDPSTGKTMTATFIERADKVYPDLLDKDASREALLTPFQEDKWQIDDAVINDILDDTQGYPWFIQLWGEGLWDNGLNDKTINRAVMEAANDKVIRERTSVYQARLNELNEPLDDAVGGRQVLLAARVVAERFLSQDNAPLSETELAQILDTLEESGISSNEHKSLKMRFLHAGFVVEDPAYNPPASIETPAPDSKQMYWRLGIPSLANFVVWSTSYLAPAPEPNEPALSKP